MCGRCGHEHCLNPGRLDMHLRHLKFVVKVCDRPQPFYDGLYAILLAILDQKSAARINANIGKLLHILANHLDSLFNREEARFVAVYEDRDYDFIELQAGALNNVEVAKGDGIKGPWAHSAFHGANASNESGCYPFSPSVSVGAP